MPGQPARSGPHTLSFAAALKSALREDPDCILVGEMRDLETIRLAMTAAETGHLVFGTLHTSSAAKTIDRIIDVFPADEKEMVRAMLSESLQAVISQTLCKTKDGQGRVAAHEIMLGTSAIRNLIREAKVAQMYSSIQTGNSVGMQTLDQNLSDLVKRNVISPQRPAAKQKSPRTSRLMERDTMEDKIKGLLGRIRGTDKTPDDTDAQDSVLFSRAFEGHGVDPSSLVPWEARAVEIGASRLKPATGIARLQALWASGKFMSHLDKDALKPLGNYLSFATIPADRDLIRQDEYGNFMVILLRGSIAVDRVQPWGARLHLAETSEGDILGEMSLLDSGIRFSEVRDHLRMRCGCTQCRRHGRDAHQGAPFGRHFYCTAGPQTVTPLARCQCAAERKNLIEQRKHHHGTRSGHQICQRPAEADDQPQRQRLVYHRRLSARHQGGWQSDQSIPTTP